MAIRVKHQVLLTISNDTAGKQKLFATDDTLDTVVSDNYTNCVSGRLSVPATTTFSIDFEAITLCRGAYIQTDSECSIKINGEAPISLKAGSADGGPCRFFIEAAITSLQVTALAVTLVGRYSLWGDLVV